MLYTNEVSQFEPVITLLDETDDVLGGEFGPDNVAPKQLANRTRWLYDTLKALITTVAGIRTVGELQWVGALGYIATDYDSTGKGTGAALGWALANGQNGTDNLAGKFVAGMDATSIDYATPGLTGGAESVNLTAAQNGPHTHDINLSLTDSGGQVSNRTTAMYGSPGAYTSGKPTLAQSGTGAAHENRPPFYVAVVRQWIGI